MKVKKLTAVVIQFDTMVSYIGIPFGNAPEETVPIEPEKPKSKPKFTVITNNGDKDEKN